MAVKSIDITPTPVTSDTTAPTASAAVGAETNDLTVGGNVPDVGTVIVAATAAGGTLACDPIELFGLGWTSDRFVSLGTLGSVALAETDTNKIDKTYVIRNPGHFKRLVPHITGITGTTPSFQVFVEVETVID